MARTAEAAAPCRADLAGGTLDIWPIGLLHPGAVTVNACLGVGVRLEVADDGPAQRVVHVARNGHESLLGVSDALHDLTAAVCFALRPEGGLRVRVVSQPPVGSGLGGSSAYGVALSRAVLELEGRAAGDDWVVRLVRDLEARVLGTPTGTQDHWAAALGGVLAVHLEPGGERVERLAVETKWLNRRLLVFYTGIVHHSGMVNWQVVRRRLDGEPEAAAGFQAIAEAAERCRAALLEADDGEVGSAISADWQARRRLAPEVEPRELGSLAATAVEAGALAVKACGAGGGGSLLTWCRPDEQEAVGRALESAAPQGRILHPVRGSDSGR